LPTRSSRSALVCTEEAIGPGIGRCGIKIKGVLHYGGTKKKDLEISS
jgi:hypothetical protein